MLQDEIKPKEDRIEVISILRLFKIHTSQVMKQQILDMERELTKSVKDQGENLAVIEDIKSKLAASSSELLAGRRRVGQLQTSFGRCTLSLR